MTPTERELMLEFCNEMVASGAPADLKIHCVVDDMPDDIQSLTPWLMGDHTLTELRAIASGRVN